MTTTRRRPRAPNIIHLDPRLLVVDKPPGIPLTSQRGQCPGLPDLLRGHPQLTQHEPFRIVHRLPEQASGIVVYARTLAAQQILTTQFDRGQATIAYLALVTGYVADDGEINIPLYYDKRAGKLVASQRRGNHALTRYRIIQRVAGHTLLECQPLHERTDQVRAHLAAIGHPLTVDPEFGGGSAVLLSEYKPDYRPSGRRPERPLVERLTMHAATVSLVHPDRQSPLQFAAPLPKDLSATLTQLGRLC